jgi:5'-nucleotidase
MSYPIEKKLVIVISSSALFDLSDSDKVYKEQGLEEYRKFQEKNIDQVLPKGVAFPFIRRFLNLNQAFPEQEPVEVILMSRNSPETGLRVFRSIQHYKLNISRAAFLSGTSPFKYIPAYNATLFLSANKEDVANAVNAGFAAGRVIETKIEDDENDKELRIAFDFDGVIADDQAELVYQKTKDLSKFHEHETKMMEKALNPGPLNDLFQKISHFQEMERERQHADPAYKRILKTSIITARNAPSHERMVFTLKEWGVDVDEAFFLGGIEKRRILEIMKPHIFFDDQMGHLEHIEHIPAVHIPFGISNKKI